MISNNSFNMFSGDLNRIQLLLIYGSQQKLHLPQQPRDIVITSNSLLLPTWFLYLCLLRRLAGKGKESKSPIRGLSGLWIIRLPFLYESPRTPSGEPFCTSSFTVSSPSPLTIISTCGCESNSSGIAVG